MKTYLDLGKLVPLLTILGAASAIVLSMLGILSISIAENVIIGLLALLAVDALTERISVLSKIETKLNSLTARQALRSRVEIIPIEDQAGNASEICIIAMSGIGIISRNGSFFERRLKEGCNIKLILLDPSSPSVKTLDLLSETVVAKADIQSSLGQLKSFVGLPKAKGKLEIKLSQALIPYSMVATDVHRESGTMIVEYLGYQTKWDARPHVFLRKTDNSYWYNSYAEQFNRAWKDAQKWTP